MLLIFLLCFCTKSREEACAKILKSVGANGHLIHSSDNLDVIAGQGTIGLEVLEQVNMTYCVHFTVLLEHQSLV